MKINGISSNKVINLYGVKNNKHVQSKKFTSTKDKLEISDVGKNLSMFFEDKNAIPDHKKVKDIKDKIDNGEYKINSKDIAKSLIEIMDRKES